MTRCKIIVSNIVTYNDDRPPYVHIAMKLGLKRLEVLVEVEQQRNTGKSFR
jgi:hypothetical protein